VGDGSDGARGGYPEASRHVGGVLVWVAGDCAVPVRYGAWPAGAWISSERIGGGWEGLGGGDKATSACLFPKQEMTCGWEVEFGQRNINGVSLECSVENDL
jgi:hypothetical protein